MENNFLDLFKAYTDLLKFKREREEDIKARQEGLKFQRTNPRTTPKFELVYDDGKRGMSSHSNQYLITLDEEDIEYFKDKYLPKFKKEKEKAINKIKSEYNLIIQAIIQQEDEKHHDKILFISLEEVDKIINTGKPIGLFYAKDKENYIAIDNSTRNAWTEEFKTELDTIKWLSRK